jgi:cell wall-associated NlpC family hydrolase
MPIPLWAGRYIGLPFRDHGRDRSGLDCWGLVRLVLSEQFGCMLPSFAQEYPHSRATEKISDVILREIPLWDAVQAGAERAGDVIVLRLCGKPLHVGTVLGDAHMLHIESGINSAIERYDGTRWKDRVFGFYRYRKVF